MQDNTYISLRKKSKINDINNRILIKKTCFSFKIIIKLRSYDLLLFSIYIIIETRQCGITKKMKKIYNKQQKKIIMKKKTLQISK